MSVNVSRKKNHLTKVEQLELENQEMEERLRNFRESMAREKAKRSFSSGKIKADKSDSSIWIAGESRKGSLSKYAYDVLHKKKARGFTGIGMEVDSAVKSMMERSIENPFPASSTPPYQNEKTLKFNLTPVPPSAEISLSQAKRSWRVPTAMKIHEPEKEELPSVASLQPYLPSQDSSILTNTQDSLLEGDEFDPDASHQSFLEALRQWRGEPVQIEQSVSKPPLPIPHPPTMAPAYTANYQRSKTLSIDEHLYSTNSSISIETNTFDQIEEKKPVQFEFMATNDLSYFDRLRLQKGYNSNPKSPVPVENTERIDTVKPIKGNVCDDVDEKPPKDEEWDSEDEQLFLQILSQKKSKLGDLHDDQNDQTCEFKIDQDWDNLEFTGLTPPKPSNDRCILIMQDITGFEDESIMDSLDAGIMVECIPTTRLKVIEPADL